jgi:hypothetical protein
VPHNLRGSWDPPCYPNSKFLQCGEVFTTRNPQNYMLSGLCHFTSLAWVALPGSCAPASLVIQDSGPRGPSTVKRQYSRRGCPCDTISGLHATLVLAACAFGHSLGYCNRADSQPSLCRFSNPPTCYSLRGIKYVSCQWRLLLYFQTASPSI